MPSDGSPPAPRGIDGVPARSWVHPPARDLDGQADGHPDGSAVRSPGAAQFWAVQEIARLEQSLAAADRTHEGLQAALQSNRRIGMAIGILMALRKIPEEQAFEVLRRASSVRNVKLRLVAEEVIRTGTLD